MAKGHPMIHDLLPTINATGLKFESKCKRTTSYGLTDPVYIDCYKREKICMWGDSQMRHLYNTIVAALSLRSADALTDPLDGQESITYFSKHYDNFDEDIDSLLASGKCSVMRTLDNGRQAGHKVMPGHLINFGYIWRPI